MQNKTLACECRKDQFWDFARSSAADCNVAKRYAEATGLTQLHRRITTQTLHVAPEIGLKGNGGEAGEVSRWVSSVGFALT